AERLQAGSLYPNGHLRRPHALALCRARGGDRGILRELERIAGVLGLPARLNLLPIRLIGGGEQGESTEVLCEPPRRRGVLEGRAREGICSVVEVVRPKDQ